MLDLADNSGSSRHTKFKIFFSIWIIFHLSCVLLAPNRDNFISFRFKSIIEPYVSTIGMAATWSFFAPEPGPPPLYVDYLVKNQADKTIAEGSWPERKDPFWFRERQNRRIAAARLMVQNGTFADKMMIPFLCKRFKNASTLQLWRVIYSIAPISEVESGKRSIGDGKGEDRMWVGSSSCPEISL